MAESALKFVEEFLKDPANEQLYREAEARHNLSTVMTSLRKTAGLSQASLAERVGRKQPFIAKLEAGGYDRCGIGTLQTFAQAMGFSMDFERMFVPSATFFSGYSDCADLEVQFPEDIEEQEVPEFLSAIERLIVPRWTSYANDSTPYIDHRGVPAASPLAA